MFAVGDIVEIFAPQAGHKKYHLCIASGDTQVAHQFLYLNSDPSFDETLVVDCSRVPCIPKSKTGKTVFTFAILPRYSNDQLKLYAAKCLGVIDPELAADVRVFVRTVKTLTASERKRVIAALDLMCCD